MITHTIPICYRSSDSGEIMITTAPYSGAVDEKTMRGVNKLFLEKVASGYFYPLDPMDAYHDVWFALERKTANLPELTSASPHTYLCAVARLLFLNWFKRRVETTRSMHKQIDEKRKSKKGAVGVDDFDIDNYDATCEEIVLPEGDLFENSPAPISSQAKEARLIITEIIRCLPDEPTRAFHAYIVADGNFFVAAKLAKIPLSTYYHKWPKWIALARAISEKITLKH